MAERRTISQLTPVEVDTIRIHYVTAKVPTLADLAEKFALSFTALTRHSASEGWSDLRSRYRMESAQIENCSTGVDAAGAQANLMRAIRDCAATAAELAAVAASSLDDDDFDRAFAKIQQVSRLLGEVKGTIGPAASGLNTISSAPTQAGVKSDADAEHVPTNVLSTAQDLVGVVITNLTEAWSEGQQRTIDAKQSEEMARAGVPARVAPPAAPPAAPPTVGQTRYE